jgi:hypothetical protein
VEDEGNRSHGPGGGNGIGTVSTLDDAVAAFNPTGRRPGKTIIRIRP